MPLSSKLSNIDSESSPGDCAEGGTYLVVNREYWG